MMMTSKLMQGPLGLALGAALVLGGPLSQTSAIAQERVTDSSSCLFDHSATRKQVPPFPAPSDHH
jgi:hypothetical protein